MAQIKIRRGTDAQLDGITLALAELGFTTDTKKLYIGDGVSNILINEDQPEYLTESVTKTVGVGQDFTTLNDAFEWLETIDAITADPTIPNPDYPYNGNQFITITLSLTAGTFDSTGSTGGGWKLFNKSYGLTIVGATSATTTLSSCEFVFKDMGDINIDNLTMSNCYYRTVRCNTCLGLATDWTSIKDEDFVATGTSFQGNGSLNFQGTGVYTDCQLSAFDGAEIFLYGSENVSSRGAWSFNTIGAGSDSYMYIDPYYSGHGDLTVGRVLSYGGKVDLGPDQSYGATGKLVIEKVGTRNASYMIAQGGGRIHLWASEIEVKHAYNWTTYPGMTGAFVAVDGSQIVFRDDKVTDITVTTLADANTPCFNVKNLGRIVYDESTVTFNAPSGFQNNTPAGQIQTDGSCIYDTTAVPTTEYDITEDTTYTVGSGGDFANIYDASVHVSKCRAVGQDSAHWSEGFESPKITLTLLDATHDMDDSPETGEITFQNYNGPLVIEGTSSAATTLNGDSITVRNCDTFLIDKMTLTSAVLIEHCKQTCYVGYSDFILNQPTSANGDYSRGVQSEGVITYIYCYGTSGYINYLASRSGGGIWLYAGVSEAIDLTIGSILAEHKGNVTVDFGTTALTSLTVGIVDAVYGSNVHIFTYDIDVTMVAQTGWGSCYIRSENDGKIIWQGNGGTINITPSATPVTLNSSIGNVIEPALTITNLAADKTGISLDEDSLCEISFDTDITFSGNLGTDNEYSYPIGQVQSNGSCIYVKGTVPTTENIITEDVTKTVGAGQDFTTLAEAAAWIESLVPAGISDTEHWGYGKDPVTITLSLIAGTHTLTSDVTFANWKGRLLIEGTGVSTCTITGDFYLSFHSFHSITMDELKYESGLAFYSCSGEVYIGWNDIEIDTTQDIRISECSVSAYVNGTTINIGNIFTYNGQFYMYHQEATSTLNIDQLYASTNGFVYLYTSQSDSTVNIEVIRSLYGSTVEISLSGADLNVNNHNGATKTEVDCYSNSKLNIEGGDVDITPTLPGATDYALRCKDNSSINISGALTITNLPASRTGIYVNNVGTIASESITFTNSLGTNTNVPIAVIQPDGSCIYDGETFVEYIYEDTTKTVGAGQDFETLDEAFQWASDVKPGAATPSTQGGSDRATPMIILDLIAGDHYLTDKSPDMWYNRIHGAECRVTIKGAGVTSTTIKAHENMQLAFVDCIRLSIHSLSIEGGVYATGGEHIFFFGSWKLGEDPVRFLKGATVDTSGSYISIGNCVDVQFQGLDANPNTFDGTIQIYRSKGFSFGETFSAPDAKLRIYEGEFYQQSTSGSVQQEFKEIEVTDNSYLVVDGNGGGFVKTNYLHLTENSVLEIKNGLDVGKILVEKGGKIIQSDASITINCTAIDATYTGQIVLQNGAEMIFGSGATVNIDTYTGIAPFYVKDGSLVKIPGTLTVDVDSASYYGVSVSDSSEAYLGDVTITGTFNSEYNIPAGQRQTDGSIIYDGTTAPVDDTPVDAATGKPISSNWAYDHQLSNNPHNSATDLNFKLGDASGSYAFSVRTNADDGVFDVYSDGQMTITNTVSIDATLDFTFGTGGIYLDTATPIEARADQNITVKLGDAAGVTSFILEDSGGSSVVDINSAGDMLINGNITMFSGQYIVEYPGITGDAEIGFNSGSFEVKLGDAAGSDKLSIIDSGDVEQFSVDSDGNVVLNGSIYLDNGRSIVEDTGAAGDASFSLSDGNVFNYLGDAAGVTYFGVVDSGINDVFTVDSDGNVTAKGNLSLFTGNGDILMDNNNQIILQNSTDRLAIKLGDDAGFSTFEILNSSAATVFWVDALGDASFDGDVDFQGAATGNGTVPTGGTSNQILTKNSNTDYDLVWSTPSAGSSVTISDTAPGSPTAGDLWFDSAAGIMSMYYNDGNTTQWVSLSSGSWGSFPLHDTPTDGATTDAITSNWAYDHENAADPHTGYVLESNVDDTPVDSATTDPISSNWAYDHENSTEVHMSISTAITTDPNNLTAGLVLCSHTNTPSGDANYWYIQTWQYLASSNRSQIATRYNPGGVSSELWIRHFYTSGWEDWVQMQDAAFAIQKDADTGSARLPSGTTAQRTASPSAGDIRFNTTDTGFEGWNGTSWGSIGGGATGAAGSGDKVFWENDTNVTTSYTITSGQNAMSAGPITIDDGVTVTVPDGSVWTIV